jgi:hypothetical protein
MKIRIKTIPVVFSEYYNAEEVLEETKEVLKLSKELKDCVKVTYEILEDGYTLPYWVFYREETKEEEEQRVAKQKEEYRRGKQKQYDQLKKELGYED